MSKNVLSECNWSHRTLAQSLFASTPCVWRLIFWSFLTMTKQDQAPPSVSTDKFSPKALNFGNDFVLRVHFFWDTLYIFSQIFNVGQVELLAGSCKEGGRRRNGSLPSCNLLHGSKQDNSSELSIKYYDWGHAIALKFKREISCISTGTRKSISSHTPWILL